MSAGAVEGGIRSALGHAVCAGNTLALAGLLLALPVSRIVAPIAAGRAPPPRTLPTLRRTIGRAPGARGPRGPLGAPRAAGAPRGPPRGRPPPVRGRPSAPPPAR